MPGLNMDLYYHFHKMQLHMKDLERRSHTPPETRSVQAAFKLLNSECRIAAKPYFELYDGITDGLPGALGSERPLQIISPRGLNDYNREVFFRKWGYYDEILSDVDPAALRERYFRSLSHDRPLHGGSIDYNLDGTVTVQAGNRRYASLTEQAISQGLMIMQHSCDGWLGMFAKPALYSQCIAPAIKENDISSPLAWAVPRLKIVFGFIDQMGSGDLAATTFEEIYGRMAEIAANPPPESLKEPRSYQLNAHRKALLDAAAELSHSPIVPEAAIFLIENDAFLRPEDLKRDPLARFILQLPQALENGLVIDRISELTLAHVQHGADPRDVVSHAVRLASTIYLAEQDGAPLMKPWYFKEDFDLRPAEPEYGWTAAERAHDQLIAATANFHYTDARKLYYRSGYRLGDLEGIPADRAIECSSKIASLYGIGHVERASNVIDFVQAYLHEAKPAQRMAALADLERLLERQRAKTPVIGILEGSDTNFEKPGYTSMVCALLTTEKDPEAWINCLRITPEQMIAVAKKTALPLAERAKIRPALAYDFRTTPLLTDHSDTGALALPISEDLKGNLPAERPLASWLTLQQRFIDECPNDPDSVAVVYYAFFAQKMPEPFNPPEGFLSFIDEYRTIREHEDRDVLFEHPDERALVSHENAQRAIDRYMVIANLLDCWVIGVADWNQLNQIFAWVLAEPTKEELKQIQIDLDWQAKEYYDPLYPRETKALAEYEDYARALTQDFQEQHRAQWLYHGGISRWRHNSFKETLRDTEICIRNATRTLAGEITLRERYLNRTLSKRDARVARGLKPALQERTKGQRVERLQQLKAIVDDTKLVVGLTAAAIIPPHRLANCFSGTVKALKAGVRYPYLPYAAYQHLSSIEGDRLAAGLAELRKKGLCDMQAIEEAVSACTTLAEAAKLMRKLAPVPDAIQSLKQNVFSESWRFRDFKSDPKGAWQQMREKRSRMLEGLKRKLANVPFLVQNAADLLLVESFWVDRYSASWPFLHDFQQRVLGDAPIEGQHGSADASQTMRKSNFQLLSTWFLQHGLAIYDQTRHLLTTEEWESLRIGHDQQSTKEKRAGALIVADSDPQRMIERRFQAIEQELELCKSTISAARDRAFGLLSVGGKINVMHEMDATHIDFLAAQLEINYNSLSTFQLQHSNKTLVLPPLPTSEEWKVVIDFLIREGVIDFDHPELQIALPGRLRAKRCPYLGAAVLLATERRVNYREDAFFSTHNPETGYRIMAYDASGPRSEFPFSTPIEGRIDMFGRQHHNDVDRYQLFGSVLIYAQEHGQLGRVIGSGFQDLEHRYCSQLEEILGDYGLAHVLQARWVNTREGELTDAKEHYTIIKSCTDAWKACADRCLETGINEGLVPEVRKMFDSLRLEVAELQQLMRRARRFKFQRELLLNI